MKKRFLPLFALLLTVILCSCGTIKKASSSIEFRLPGAIENRSAAGLAKLAFVDHFTVTLSSRENDYYFRNDYKPGTTVKISDVVAGSCLLEVTACQKFNGEFVCIGGTKKEVTVEEGKTTRVELSLFLNPEGTQELPAGAIGSLSNPIKNFKELKQVVEATSKDPKYSCLATLIYISQNFNTSDYMDVSEPITMDEGNIILLPSASVDSIVINVPSSMEEAVFKLSKNARLAIGGVSEDLSTSFEINGGNKDGLVIASVKDEATFALKNVQFKDFKNVESGKGLIDANNEANLFFEDVRFDSCNPGTSSNLINIGNTNRGQQQGMFCFKDLYVDKDTCDNVLCYVFSGSDICLDGMIQLPWKDSGSIILNANCHYSGREAGVDRAPMVYLGDDFDIYEDNWFCVALTIGELDSSLNYYFPNRGDYYIGYNYPTVFASYGSKAIEELDVDKKISLTVLKKDTNRPYIPWGVVEVNYLGELCYILYNSLSESSPVLSDVVPSGKLILRTSAEIQNYTTVETKTCDSPFAIYGSVACSNSTITVSTTPAIIANNSARGEDGFAFKIDGTTQRIKIETDIAAQTTYSDSTIESKTVSYLKNVDMDTEYTNGIKMLPGDDGAESSLTLEGCTITSDRDYTITGQNYYSIVVDGQNQTLTLKGNCDIRSIKVNKPGFKIVIDKSFEPVRRPVVTLSADYDSYYGLVDCAGDATKYISLDENCPFDLNVNGGLLKARDFVGMDALTTGDLVAAAVNKNNSTAYKSVYRLSDNMDFTTKLTTKANTNIYLWSGRTDNRTSITLTPSSSIVGGLFEVSNGSTLDLKALEISQNTSTAINNPMISLAVGGKIKIRGTNITGPCTSPYGMIATNSTSTVVIQNSTLTNNSSFPILCVAERTTAEIVSSNFKSSSSTPMSIMIDGTNANDSNPCYVSFSGKNYLNNIYITNSANSSEWALIRLQDSFELDETAGTVTVYLPEVPSGTKIVDNRGDPSKLEKFKFKMGENSTDVTLTEDGRVQ